MQSRGLTKVSTSFVIKIMVIWYGPHPASPNGGRVYPQLSFSKLLYENAESLLVKVKETNCSCKPSPPWRGEVDE
jgi:hypothetical protein